MKKVTATNKAIKVERRWEIDVIAVHSGFRSGTLSISARVMPRNIPAPQRSAW
jgi:hypothetical protein